MSTPEPVTAAWLMDALIGSPADPYGVTEHSATTLVLRVGPHNAERLAYVTVSDRPPKESRELAELEEMDTLLKASMLAVSDAKTLREIVGERRQLQKQMSQLRTSLSSGDPSGSKGKLDELKGREW